MSEYTSKYVRPPPTHPVPFAGFRFAKILSREPVELRLKQVLKKSREATALTVTIIKAEWGEGKTDAYERYIKPEVESNGDIAYLVSTSTIINKLSKANVLLPTNPPESVTLLSIIFYSIKDELKSRNEDFSLFPDESIFKDPYLYIEKTLRNHLTAKTKKKLYIFIDEFEEILIHPPEVQKKFLSGLKELINGQLKIIHTDGEFQGSIHFFIACTPYAYNRLKEDVELKEIFGSISSRIGTNIIDLPQISRKEAVQFLIDILKYCYDGKLPKPLPIKSTGILYGVSTISQRNLRPMIQFIGELLNAASTDDKLAVIDYQIFINTMRGREISVFGETTSCIDDDLLTKIERALLNNRSYGAKCLELFKLLAGELKPFSLEEIEKRLGLDCGQIHNLVEIINQELSKIGISKAVSRLVPLKEGKMVDEVIDSLKSDERSILLIHNKLPLNKFEDEFVYYEINESGNLKSSFVIPREDDEILKSFEIFEDVKIDEEDVKFLKHKLEKYLEPVAKETRFMLSKELSLQLFPSPVISQIDFIEDRQKRMVLWREAIKNFADMDKDLRDGFIEVVNSTEEFNISGVPNNYRLKCYLQPGLETIISLAIYASTMGINMNDINNIKELLRKEKVDLLLVVYVGSIDEDASYELANITRALPIQLKTIRAQQLIALSLARNRGIKINDKQLKVKLESIYHEVGFPRSFSNWVERCKNQGILLTDLIKPSGEKDKTLADAMVYYIEKIGSPLTLESIYDNVERLRSFTLYGTKAPFCPIDIEKPEDLSIYHKDLVVNGFIKENEDGSIEILISPPEKRILELVNQGVKTINEIKHNFIILAQNKELIEQVYLPVLESKGLITIEKDFVELVNLKEFEQKTVKEIQAYHRKIEELKNQCWDYSHICISKERESRIIMLEDFDSFLKQLWSQCESVNIKYSEELKARLFCLINALLKYFNENLYTTVKEAFNRGRAIIQEINQTFKDTESILCRILEEYNRYSEKKYLLDDFDEYNVLQGLRSEVEKKLNKIYTREEIKDGVDYIENTIYRVKGRFEGYLKYFYFKKPPEQASYFNYKVYDIEQNILKRVKSKCAEIRDKADKIFECINDCSELYSDISAELSKYAISDHYKLSKAVFNSLKNYQSIPMKTSPLAILSLEDVNSFFESLYRTLKDYSSKVKVSLNIINNLINNEKSLIFAKNEIITKAENLKIFFEGCELQVIKIANVFSKLADVEKEYESLCVSGQYLSEKIKAIDDFNNVTQNILAKLSELKLSLSSLDDELKGICQERINHIKAYESNITKMLDVLKEAGEDATVLKNTFKQIAEDATGYLNSLLVGMSVKVKWSEIEKDLSDLKKQLLNRVRRILSEEEFEVLLSIIDKSTTRRWLTMPEIINDVALALSIEPEQVSEIIDRLTEKKLLKKGISLPIEFT
jgi:acylphosphatase